MATTFHMPTAGPEILACQTIRGVISLLMERNPATAVHVVRYYMLKDLRSCYVALTTGIQTPEMMYGANAAEALANMLYDSTIRPCPGNTADVVDGLCATLKACESHYKPCQAVADISNDVLHFLRQLQLYRALDRVCRAVAVRGHNDSFAQHLADINGNDDEDDAFDVDSREFRPIVRKTAQSVKRGRGRPRKDAMEAKELERAKRLHAITFGAGAAPDVALLCSARQ